MVGWMGRWVVDNTKIMQCHLLTEVGVEVEDELGKNTKKVLSVCLSVCLPYFFPFEIL